MNIVVCHFVGFSECLIFHGPNVIEKIRRFFAFFLKGPHCLETCRLISRWTEKKKKQFSVSEVICKQFVTESDPHSKDQAHINREIFDCEHRIISTLEAFFATSINQKHNRTKKIDEFVLHKLYQQKIADWNKIVRRKANSWGEIWLWVFSEISSIFWIYVWIKNEILPQENAMIFILQWSRPAKCCWFECRCTKSSLM